MKNFWILSIIILATNALSAQKKWSLQECVDYAVTKNLQVISNQYTKEIEDKNLLMAKNEKKPSVSGSIGNNLSFGQTQNYTSNNYFSNNMSVGADIILYNNERLQKQVRKTEFDVEAALYDLKTIKNDISVQIAQRYLSILLNREIEKINLSAMENAQKVYDRAKITTEVGTTAETVLAEATAALAREKQNVKTAQINTRTSLFDLAQLLQIEDYKSFDVEDVTLREEMFKTPLSDEEAIAKAYDNQPQIKAAESRIKSAEAQTEVSKTAFYPTITGTAGVGTSYFNSLDTKENGFLKQYNTNFGPQLGLSANIPIFNKGNTRLQVEQAKINESIAKNGLDQKKQEVLQDVQKALFQAESNYETYFAALESERSSKLALDFAEKSYAAGRSTIYDVNVARNNYANAQGNVAQAKYNYLFSLKVVDFYTGIPLSL